MLPAKAASDWKKSWFYVTEATPEDEAAIPRYSANRSEPRHLQVGKLPDDQRMVVDEMLQTIRGLKKKGLQTINLYNCWLGGGSSRSPNAIITCTSTRAGETRQKPA